MASVKIGNIPTEATSKGSLNEAPPMSERTPNGAPVGTGPVRGEKDEFLPATYPVRSGNIRTDR